MSVDGLDTRLVIHQVIEAPGGGFLKAGDHMAVNVQRHFNTAMPKPFLDNLRMNATLEQRNEKNERTE